jgi:hypothetical protein
MLATPVAQSGARDQPARPVGVDSRGNAWTVVVKALDRPKDMTASTPCSSNARHHLRAHNKVTTTATPRHKGVRHKGRPTSGARTFHRYDIEPASSDHTTPFALEQQPSPTTDSSSGIDDGGGGGHCHHGAAHPSALRTPNWLAQQDQDCSSTAEAGRRVGAPLGTGELGLAAAEVSKVNTPLTGASLSSSPILPDPAQPARTLRAPHEGGAFAGVGILPPDHHSDASMTVRPTIRTYQQVKIAGTTARDRAKVARSAVQTDDQLRQQWRSRLKQAQCLHVPVTSLQRRLVQHRPASDMSVQPRRRGPHTATATAAVARERWIEAGEASIDTPAQVRSSLNHCI